MFVHIHTNSDTCLMGEVASDNLETLLADISEMAQNSGFVMLKEAFGDHKDTITSVAASMIELVREVPAEKIEAMRKEEESAEDKFEDIKELLDRLFDKKESTTNKE